MTSQYLSLYISLRQQQQTAFPNLFDHRILPLWSKLIGLVFFLKHFEKYHLSCMFINMEKYDELMFTPEMCLF